MPKYVVSSKKKVSELPEATSLGGSELLPLVQGGVTKKAALSDVSTFIGYGVPFVVTSINGEHGDLTVNATTIGLENVDNTSDISKPISSDTQDALDLKLDTSSASSVALSGNYSDLIGAPVLSTVATSGAYSDLSGLPTLGTAASTAATDYATAAQGSTADTALQPGDSIPVGDVTGLATVAASGDYSDLSGLPSLGTAAAQDISAFSTPLPGLGVYTPGTSDYLAGTQSGVPVRFAMNTLTSALTWTSAGTGATSRTLSGRLSDTISVKDFGAVGDGVTDNSAALAAAHAHAVLIGSRVYYPPGDYKHNSGITATTVVPIVGAGEGATIVRTSFNGPLITYTNSSPPSHLTFGDFVFIGPGNAATNTLSCCLYFASTSAGMSFCKFKNITAQAAFAFMRSDSLAVSGGGGWRGTISWCNFKDINMRNGMKYGFLWNQGSGTGNRWTGGKPSIGIPGGAFIEINGAPAVSNSNAGINVGDILIDGVHAISETGEASGAHTSALLRGGPNTTYRSRIGLRGCQFDAALDRPLDLSAVGSVPWTNIDVQPNNFGGNVKLYPYVPPLWRSRVRDQGVSVWEAQYSGSNAIATAATRDIFQVAVQEQSGCKVTIVVTGLIGTAGTLAAEFSFLLRRGLSSTAIYAITPIIWGASSSPSIAAVSDANGVVTFTLSTTSGGGTSTYDCQIVVRGGGFKVQNGYYL